VVSGRTLHFYDSPAGVQSEGGRELEGMAGGSRGGHVGADLGVRPHS
jgi:hypothetical protein